jgi:DMSO/TMAO reductase YedYZ heme-binding membrane subunit
MKIYLKSIKQLQLILLTVSVAVMMVLPIVLVFSPDLMSDAVIQNLYEVSHVFLFFVMMIRPLADIFIENRWLRPLVILRKGAGVMSAAIVVSFLLSKLIMDPLGYIGSIGTLQYWSMWDYAVLAHMADISAVILIVTSNNLSKKLLGSWWKKVQKLSYVYFYGSALYVFLSYGDAALLVAMIMVTALTLMAFLENRRRRQLVLNPT